MMPLRSTSFSSGVYFFFIFTAGTWIFKSFQPKPLKYLHLPDLLPYDSSHKHKDIDGKSLADVLFNKTKILCLIFTFPKNHQSKAVHVNRTWGANCNKLAFMTSEAEDDLPTIPLPIKEGRNSLWNKTKNAYKWAYDNHLQDYDWFFKGDDDTFAVIENMRYLLSFYNPDEPWFFGSRFKLYAKYGYMSGGGGYMLSRASVKLLVEKGIKDPKICRQETDGNEDVEMGRCMSGLEVSYGDTRDQYGRWRFFPLNPPTFFQRENIYEGHWFWLLIYYNISMDLNCCSDTAATYHYVSPNRFYFYHYLIYHMKHLKNFKAERNLPKVIFDNRNDGE